MPLVSSCFIGSLSENKLTHPDQVEKFLKEAKVVLLWHCSKEPFFGTFILKTAESQGGREMEGESEIGQAGEASG